MAKKEGNFFELYIEKIVLVLVGIIAAFLLIFFVVLTPSKVKFDGRTFTASNIDNYIREKALIIKDDLQKPPEPKAPPISVKNEFQEIIAKAVDIDPGLFEGRLPTPTEDDSARPKYNVPQMIEINNVAAELIRTVGYVPLRDVSTEVPYEQNICEPNDIDIVTVQGQIDTTLLYEKFKEVFDGEDVQENWRSEEYATPVFAAVHLQRQELLPDGSWSNFSDVPRAKIETNKELFQIVEDVDKLPVTGKLNVRLLEYRNKTMQLQLVQPEPYVMAIAQEQWMPPVFHYKYKEIVAVLKEQAARQVREDRLRSSRSSVSDAGGRSGGRSGGRTGGAGRTTGAATTRPSEGDNQADVASLLNQLKNNSQELTKLYEDFQSGELNEDTDLENAEKPLLFWAFDDTVEPSKSYRYQIRLGVFNPVAGSDKFKDPQHPDKNNCILFSKFIEAPQIVNVQQKTAFFPVRKASNSAKVSVDVYAYKLGHWYRNNFSVSPGEMIGKALENPDYNSDDALAMMSTGSERGGRESGMGSALDSLRPEVINYNTGAMYLDYTKVEYWSGSANIYRKPYYEMLYSLDGKNIFNIPIITDGKSHWSDNIENVYRDLGIAVKEPVPALISWQRKTTSTRRNVTPAPVDSGVRGAGAGRS